MSPILNRQEVIQEARIQEMNEKERMQILSKIEGLGLRVGALVTSAKLIENELIQLQDVFYQKTKEVREV